MTAIEFYWTDKAWREAYRLARSAEMGLRGEEAVAFADAHWRITAGAAS